MVSTYSEIVHNMCKSFIETVHIIWAQSQNTYISFRGGKTFSSYTEMSSINPYYGSTCLLWLLLYSMEISQKAYTRLSGVPKCESRYLVTATTWLWRTSYNGDNTSTCFVFLVTHRNNRTHLNIIILKSTTPHKYCFYSNRYRVHNRATINMQ